MTYLIYILIAGVGGFIFGWIAKGTFALRPFNYIQGKNAREPYFAKVAPDELEEIREEAREALTERTEQRKEKILDFMSHEAAHQEELKGCKVGHNSAGSTGSPQVGRDGQHQNKQGIICSDVEKLLGVSNGTANRYLNALEDEGKVKQVGERGSSVYYTLSN